MKDIYDFYGKFVNDLKQGFTDGEEIEVTFKLKVNEDGELCMALPCMNAFDENGELFRHVNPIDYTVIDAFEDLDNLYAKIDEAEVDTSID